MKKCAHCGGENAVSAPKCQTCGSVSFFEPTPPPIAPAAANERRDIDHLNLLSIFHFIVGFLSLCGISLLWVHHYMMGFVMAQAQANAAAKQPSSPVRALPPEFMQFLNYFYIIMGIIFVIASIVNVCSGVFLRQRKHRTFSFVVACLNCLQIPFGTVLGIFTIVVLSRNSVCDLYQKSDPR